MRILLLLLTTLTLLLSKAPEAVTYVSASELKGKWYEITRTYNEYEEGCIHPFIEYTFVNSRELTVLNRCYEKDGSLREYEGEVEPLNGDSFATLSKTYFYIFSSEYRIIYLSDDKQTMIMSDEKMEFVWLMHRKPIMSQAQRQEHIDYLQNYMDTTKLILNTQGDTQ
jgi:apolipoprotein D and lipocalin family protein